MILVGVFILSYEHHATNSTDSLNYNGYFPHIINNPFKNPPKRVLVLRPEIADTLITLGEGKSVIAAYISPERMKDIDYYRKEMPNAQILTWSLTKEEAILLNPDFIIGWQGSFNSKQLGSTTYWNHKKVPTYIEEDSGALPDPYPPFKSVNYPPFSVNNEIQFIKNMGIIFDREEQAQKEIDKINRALNTVKKLAKEKGPRTVLTMQFRKGQIEVLGDKSLSGSIISEMGCTNIDYRGLLMPVENLLMTNPDNIILIYDFVGGSFSLKSQLSKLNEYPYNKIPAVKAGRIGAMQYFDGLIATNVHTADTIWSIYKAVYEPSIITHNN